MESSKALIWFGYRTHTVGDQRSNRLWDFVHYSLVETVARRNIEETFEGIRKFVCGVITLR